MIVVFNENATDKQIQKVTEKLYDKGFDVHRSTGTAQIVLGVVGDTGTVDIRDYEVFEGVHEVIRISEPYKLASRSFKKEDTIVKVGKATFGGKQISMIAGPCSIESREQIKKIARMMKKTGTKVLRGGAYKPRTSPYAFQGMGEEGLKYLREAGDMNDMAVVSEVMDRMDIIPALKYVDMIQVGARNMQNFALLKELGKIDLPILLKRGMSATLQELLMAAEYIMAGGNHQVILCERGIRTFENYTRNTLDISAIPVLKKLSHLPVITDPSHGIGIRDKVAPMARASVAAGADGLIIETHYDPEKAFSDGAQTLYIKQYEELVKELKIIATAVKRTL
ncbi:MAG: 3-deoxy-7-phosphoheptulonate synthase [Calditrichaeota bacterium]|nr:MAG: 3-deoxy-7-phosphoheptulonate synthase [Calditrichota bacterium]